MRSAKRRKSVDLDVCERGKIVDPVDQNARMMARAIEFIRRADLAAKADDLDEYRRCVGEAICELRSLSANPLERT